MGYGSIGLNLLCDAAKQNGIKQLYDDIAIDNPSVTMFFKNGFVEEYRTSEIVMLKKELQTVPNKTVVLIGVDVLKIKPFIYAGQMCTYYSK